MEPISLDGSLGSLPGVIVAFSTALAYFVSFWHNIETSRPAAGYEVPESKSTRTARSGLSVFLLTSSAQI